jgi:hypothetical protein
MSISVSKQYLQIAKRNLSNFDENSVISFLIEILRHSNALSTPFYTPNVVHADFRVETIPANRKTQSFKFRLRLCYIVPDWDDSTFKGSFPSILHAERSACRFQGRNKPCKSQNAILQTSTKTLLFCSRLRYYGHINALSTPFYTANLLHVDFSVESFPANRKTQSFKFRRKLCYFVPDWDTTEFKPSFHSILLAERIACRFQGRNKPCKSQNAIFQFSTKTLLFRSWLRCFDV